MRTPLRFRGNPRNDGNGASARNRAAPIRAGAVHPGHCKSLRPRSRVPESRFPGKIRLVMDGGAMAGSRQGTLRGQACRPQEDVRSFGLDAPDQVQQAG
jgi:hypothetical protein